jgi:hypothetical protein
MLVLATPTFLQFRSLVKAKTLFLPMGGLVPIFDPFRRVAQQPKGELMSTLAQSLPALPFNGFEGEMKTYAAWPVWSDSTTKEIKFQPLPKKAAVKLWHRARDFDRQTDKEGCHGGAIGPTALQVLHSLIFDFLNYASGRLDPSYAAIARAANVCERSVATAIQRLKSLGILNWVRRCAEKWADERYVLEQETNAYAVLPSSQWRGYSEPVEAPPPQPGTWGDHPPLPSLLAQAVAERQAGGTIQGVIGILDADPTDPLAKALARLGRAMQGAETQ